MLNFEDVGGGVSYAVDDGRLVVRVVQSYDGDPGSIVLTLPQQVSEPILKEEREQPDQFPYFVTIEFGRPLAQVLGSFVVLEVLADPPSAFLIKAAFREGVNGLFRQIGEMMKARSLLQELTEDERQAINRLRQIVGGEEQE